MPRLIDRRTGTHLGELSEQEYVQLRALLEEYPDEGVPAAIDADALERLAESGASERLLAVARQILQGREDFDVGWESGD